jgi:hypothetical protein
MVKVLLALSLFVANSFAGDLFLSKKNTIILDEVFSQGSVAKVMYKAQKLDSSLTSKDPSYLVLYSPG